MCVFVSRLKCICRDVWEFDSDDLKIVLRHEPMAILCLHHCDTFTELMARRVYHGKTHNVKYPQRAIEWIRNKSHSTIIRHPLMELDMASRPCSTSFAEVVRREAKWILKPKSPFPRIWQVEHMLSDVKLWEPSEREEHCYVLPENSRLSVKQWKWCVDWKSTLFHFANKQFNSIIVHRFFFFG